MQKRQFLNILLRATIALVVPMLGQLFVNGWHWSVGEFVFAWIFFNILGISYTFITNKINHRGFKVVAGLLVIALFIFIWIRLATG